MFSLQYYKRESSGPKKPHETQLLPGDQIRWHHTQGGGQISFLRNPQEVPEAIRVVSGGKLQIPGKNDDKFVFRALTPEPFQDLVNMIAAVAGLCTGEVQLSETKTYYYAIFGGPR